VNTLTTREIRVIADIIERLNKARAANTEFGIPTTPDVFTARFPSGFVAVLRWTEGVRSPDPKRQSYIERCARHRDGYQLDVDTPAEPEQAVQFMDPQKPKGGEIRVDLQGGAQQMRDIARRAVRNNPHGLS